MQTDLRYIHVVDENAAAGQLRESQKRVDEGRLARTRAAHHTDLQGRSKVRARTRTVSHTRLIEKNKITVNPKLNLPTSVINVRNCISKINVSLTTEN